jgi:hypothetical protein
MAGAGWSSHGVTCSTRPAGREARARMEGGIVWNSQGVMSALLAGCEGRLWAVWAGLSGSRTRAGGQGRAGGCMGVRKQAWDWTKPYSIYYQSLYTNPSATRAAARRRAVSSSSA